MSARHASTCTKGTTPLPGPWSSKHLSTPASYQEPLPLPCPRDRDRVPTSAPDPDPRRTRPAAARPPAAPGEERSAAPCRAPAGRPAPPSGHFAVLQHSARGPPEGERWAGGAARRCPRNANSATLPLLQARGSEVTERVERPCTEEPTHYGQARSTQTRERNTRRGPMLRGTARGRQRAALPGRDGRALPAARGREIPAGSPALPCVTGKEKERRRLEAACPQWRGKGSVGPAGRRR